MLKAVTASRLPAVPLLVTIDRSCPANGVSLRNLLVSSVKRLSDKNPYIVPISRAYNAADCSPLVKVCCAQRQELQDKN
jgi:hypothetical protein